LNNNRGNNRRRGRGNNNRPQGGGQQLNRIDSRARGNAPQMLEKYRKLAQDAHLNGDRVQAEYYLQFADHYFRVIADSRTRVDEQRQRQPGERWNEQENEDDAMDFGMDADFPAFDRPQSRRDEPREQREPRENREPREQRPPRDQQPREQRDFQPRERDQRPPRDGGRFERNGQDRRFPRNDTMPMEAEQPGLPSFITAPVRNAIGAEAPVEPSFVETAVPVDPNFVEPVGVRRRGRPPKVQVPDTANDGE